MSEIQGASQQNPATGPAAIAAGPVSLRSQRRPGARSGQPLVTTRIGILFCVTAICALACGLAAISVPDAYRFQSMLWVTTIAVCSLSGLFSMRSVRTLRTIERELRRNTGHPQRWRTVRPVTGRDRITIAWNELLREAESASRPPHHRQTASLDQQAITLARAMRGLPTAWVITDLDGRMLFLSASACNLFNLSEDANHTGRDLLDLLGLRTGDETVIAKRQRLLSNVRMIHERHQVQFDGDRIHLRISRSRMDGRVGDGEGLAWILNDVSQQELATKSRDQFLLTATNELRNPLNHLLDCVEALQSDETASRESQQDLCGVIQSEAQRLGRLVDQLLTVGQMEAGSLVANRQELQINAMVEWAIEQLQSQTEAKHLKLRLECSAPLPHVFGDRDKLQAALANLIGNAVQYTPTSGEIRVRTSADGDWLRIDVQDNGPGIPPDEQEQVFEKFFRGKAAVENGTRGNGLGLAFTLEVVRSHGGDVELHSVLGEGCTFSVRLPISSHSRSGL